MYTYIITSLLPIPKQKMWNLTGPRCVQHLQAYTKRCTLTAQMGSGIRKKSKIMGRRPHLSPGGEGGGVAACTGSKEGVGGLLIKNTWVISIKVANYLVQQAPKYLGTSRQSLSYALETWLRSANNTQARSGFGWLQNLTYFC